MDNRDTRWLNCPRLYCNEERLCASPTACRAAATLPPEKRGFVVGTCPECTEWRVLTCRATMPDGKAVYRCDACHHAALAAGGAG